jgi:hypothetical protein
MVEQLAPQGWSPVDNIPSLNLVSVSFCRASIDVSQPFTLRLYDRGPLLYSESLPHVRPTTFDTNRYQPEKRFKEWG